jgi:hypothetical protein
MTPVRRSRVQDRPDCPKVILLGLKLHADLEGAAIMDLVHLEASRPPPADVPDAAGARWAPDRC